MKNRKNVIPAVLLALLMTFGALPANAAADDSYDVYDTYETSDTYDISDTSDCATTETQDTNDINYASDINDTKNSNSDEANKADSSAIYVTAQDIKRIGAQAAIQEALDTAKDNATDKKPYSVTVEPGDYELLGTLNLYSNTTLSLSGVTLRRGWERNNIMRLGPNTIFHDAGVEGYYYRNICIDGGTIDGGALPGTMLKFAHAENLTLKNTKLQNCSDSHMMEVAGIDGFTLSGCSFLNQTLDVTKEKTYEAVQIDVLKKGNFSEYRSEDLCMKNVLVENCEFNNVPRGIGSHTSVYNNPHQNITIRNNTFKNISSAAIQGLSWSGCSITGNRIDNATRGIAIYVVDSGTFLSGDLAREGNTTQHFTDDFQTWKCNAVIENNTITNSGFNMDPYASYERSAISTLGTIISNGSLPEGTYPCDTVSIKNNLIKLKGNGIRVEFADNVTVEGNVVLHQGQSEVQSDYGIVFRNGATNLNVIKNYISNPTLDGIRTITNCSSNRITDNEITGAGQYGIAVMEGSAVTETISNNKVLQSKTGIYIKSNSSAQAVENNTCSSCSTPFLITQSTGTNYSESQIVRALFLDKKTLMLRAGESYLLGRITTPINAVSTYTYSSSDTSTALVDAYGRVTAKNTGSAVISAKSANGRKVSCEVYVNTAPTPAAPTLSLSNTADGLKASWDDIRFADHYTVYYRTAAQSRWSSFDTSSVSEAIPGAVSGTLYYVQVQSIGAFGIKGSYSKVRSMTCVDRAAISSLTYNGSNRLVWNRVKGANRYQIARMKTGEKQYTYYYTTQNSFTESNVSLGANYVYQVRAMYQTEKNGTAYGAWSSSKSVITLSTPTVSLSNKSNGIRVEWNPIKGAVRYIVYFRAVSDKSWSNVKTTNTYYPFLNAKEGVEYAFQVKAVGSSVNGPYSKVHYIVYNNPYKIKPALTLSNKSNGIRAEWNAVSGATKYIVYYRTAEASKWSSVQTSSLYYPFLSAVRGKTYCFQIQTVFGSTKGAYSTVQKITFK